MRFASSVALRRGARVLRFWHVTTDIRFVSFKIQRIAVCAVGQVSKVGLMSHAVGGCLGTIMN
jgi:hypothetical protein